MSWKSCLYARAIDCLEDKEFERAEEYFMRLDDYKDSRDLLKETGYLFGIDSYEQKDYNNAIEQFSKLPTYKDVSDRLKDSYYQRGIACMKNQDFADAVSDFEKTGDDEDSKEQIVEANYQLAVGMLYYNAGEARERLIKIGDYKDAKSLLKNIKSLIIEKRIIDYIPETNTIITYAYDENGDFLKSNVIEREETSIGRGSVRPNYAGETDPALHFYQQYTPQGIIEHTAELNQEQTSVNFKIIKDSLGRPVEQVGYNDGEKDIIYKYQWNEKNQLVRKDIDTLWGSSLFGDENMGKGYTTYKYDDGDNLVEETFYSYGDNEIVQRMIYIYDYKYIRSE